MYSCGSSKYGQLGLSNEIQEKADPSVISALKGKKVSFVSCGEAHSAAVTGTSYKVMPRTTHILYLQNMVIYTLGGVEGKGNWALETGTIPQCLCWSKAWLTREL